MTLATLPLAVDQTICQYATWRVQYRWTVDDVAKDYTGWTARMQIRQKPQSTNALLTLSTSNGGVTLGPDGLITLLATDEQTATLTQSGVYDLVLYAPDGTATRFIEGTVTLDPGVTRP
jgi:hypothetical protein